MHVSSWVPLAELVKQEQEEKDARRAKRLRIIILAAQGFTAPAIALSLGLSRLVVQRWVYRSNPEGPASHADRRGKQRSSPHTAEQEAARRRQLEAGPTPEDKVCSLRGKDIQRFLQQAFGLWRCVSAVYVWLHRLGYSSFRPRPKHRRADAEAQAAFLAQRPRRLAEIQAAQPDQKLRIFFPDESRFGQQGTTTRVWARRGTRPTAVRQTEYQ